MIQMYNSGSVRDKKFLNEATQMLQDSKAKTEYIKIRINKEKQSKAEMQSGNEGRRKCNCETHKLVLQKFS